MRTSVCACVRACVRFYITAVWCYLVNRSIIKTILLTCVCAELSHGIVSYNYVQFVTCCRVVN